MIAYDKHVFNLRQKWMLVITCSLLSSFEIKFIAAALNIAASFLDIINGMGSN